MIIIEIIGILSFVAGLLAGFGISILFGREINNWIEKRAKRKNKKEGLN